jgi:hypothetical protein
VTFYWRRLPHVYETEQSVFLTWRLHDSLPPHRAFPTDALNSGQAFAAHSPAGIDCWTKPALVRSTFANRPLQTLS